MKLQYNVYLLKGTSSQNLLSNLVKHSYSLFGATYTINIVSKYDVESVLTDIIGNKVDIKNIKWLNKRALVVNKFNNADMYFCDI